MDASHTMLEKAKMRIENGGLSNRASILESGILNIDKPAYVHIQYTLKIKYFQGILFMCDDLNGNSSSRSNRTRRNRKVAS